MKKLIVTLTVMISLFACAHHHGYHAGYGPRVAYAHHHHHHHSGYFWGGVAGGLVASTIYNSLYRPTVVATPVITTPVVVQPANQVWIPGQYVDQVQANGTVIRVWRPGYYQTVP